ncbi:Putative glycosyl hydrolase domain DUF4015 [Gemmatirosa kalamazoonensis]|uniref:Putative glycosyl hydrolase domain DUF4015 n=1 Tax=Gemmatirosa kalamazoonensis TaxID=861299 RepID=W0RQP3_9BACT|nr:putative glycoside hydrolase [Gemmatirosa kalamazoonensis]AHG91873.1 Putative glycosyl hydrolase domain DUF4015 [Gemmatirosa kalamazoonensis]
MLPPSHPLRPRPALFRLLARTLLLGGLATAACDASARAGRPAGAVSDSASGTVSPGSARPAQAAVPAEAKGAEATAAALARNDGPAPAIRALYVNRFAAQSRKRMPHFIALADSTEINALVIDMKDEFGLNYHSADPKFAQNAGTMGKVRDVKAMLDTLKAHGILPIARIVVFKDSVTALLHPEWSIRREDGSIWRDKKGTPWVNPYHRELWDYNIGVAEELARMGFGEIQFDYIRFPEPYASLPKQIFPGADGMSKPDAIAAFLKEANDRLDKLGVRATADIFGLVTTVNGPLEVAQWWEKLAPVTDVLLPMVYPSHYVRGSFGIPVPNAEPYKVVNISISRARERDAKLGITGGEHVRPWLQAFSLGKPDYTAEEVRQQKQAVYDAGYDGWVLWHPGSKFEPFEAALERGELVSHKKEHPTPAPKHVE